VVADGRDGERPFWSVRHQPQRSAASFRCIMGVPAICESRQAEAAKVRVLSLPTLVGHGSKPLKAL